MAGGSHLYLIASGSNRRHGRFGSPEQVLASAHQLIEMQIEIDLIAEAPVFCTPAEGMAKRRFANSAIWIAATLDPPAMLGLLKSIERNFGRRRGRRWGDRVLDLDIILWSGGIWTSPGLAIPHSGFRHRSFVLKPLLAIASDWRDPVTGRTLRQLFHLLDRQRCKA